MKNKSEAINMSQDKKPKLSMKTSFEIKGLSVVSHDRFQNTKLAALNNDLASFNQTLSNERNSS